MGGGFMNRKLLEEIKDFFEGYEMLHKLSEERYRFMLRVLISTSKKGVVTIRITERVLKEENMFFDCRIEGNKIKMVFKLIGNKIEFFQKEFLNKYKRDFNVIILGNRVNIEIYNPKLETIISMFMEMERLCRTT